ncbi:MAG: polyprenyl synthetase family protein, partial [Candidatus Ranarchaeia archaeon]
MNKAEEGRRRRILERFGQVATSKVTDLKLLEVLEDVKKYWNDLRTHALFRPALTSFSCEAVGGKPKAAEDAGLIFTLAASGIGIHDDILDKSPYKHIRKTILGRHGIDSALLVGDLLIVKAWTMFHEMIRKAHKPSRIADIMEVYGNLSVEICEAEYMETLCRRNLETDLEYYTNVLWKAMAEMEACTKIGAIIGDGKKNEVEALAEFGRRLGFMSRLADDMEDCLNEKGDLFHRIKYESVPFPLLYAAKSSREKYLRIKNIIEKTQITRGDVKALLKFCFETKAFEYVGKIARKNEEEAASKLR